MKKLNNNGFILAETIVVAVFVLGMFTLLLTNVLPSVSQYNNVLTYDNPEDIYRINTFVDEIYSGSLEDGLYKIFDDELCKDEACSYKLTNTEFLKELISKDFLDIKEVLITNITNEANETNRGMTEYYNYFTKHNDVTENDKKIIIAKFGNGNYAGVVR